MRPTVLAGLLLAAAGTTAFRSPSGGGTIEFYADGTRAAEAGPAAVTVRDLLTGRAAYTLADPAKLRPVPQVRGEVRTLTVVFTPDGKRLLTADGTASIQVWDAATGKWERAVAAPDKAPDGKPAGPVTDVVPCPAAGRMLVRTDRHHVYHLDPTTWAWKYRGELSPIYDITAVSGDGNWLASHYNVDALYQDCYVAPAAGGAGVTIEVPDGAWRAALSADGSKAAAAGSQIRLWDVARKAPIKLDDETNPLRGIIHHLLFTPDGKTLLATADGPTVARWDTATGKRLPDLRPLGGVQRMAVTADGKHLLVAGTDAVYRRLDPATGRVRPHGRNPNPSD